MIYYVTGSRHKFESAKPRLENHGIKISQKKLRIKEIQSDSIKEIAIDKARKAFAILNEPLFVNDSGWHFAALNGFPGAFMAYVNKWLTAEDLISLMKGKRNREVMLKQIVVYIDKNRIKVFERDIFGKVLNKPSKVSGRPGEMVTSFSDRRTSEAELRARGIAAFENEADLWHKLAMFIKKH